MRRHPPSFRAAGQQARLLRRLIACDVRFVGPADLYIARRRVCFRPDTGRCGPRLSYHLSRPAVGRDPRAEPCPDARTPTPSAWRSRAAQVKAELVSVGQSGEQSLKRIETRGRSCLRRAQGPRPPGGAAAHRHPYARRRADRRDDGRGPRALVDRSISVADAIGKTADRIGVGVEALQELRFAAKASGRRAADPRYGATALHPPGGRGGAGHGRGEGRARADGHRAARPEWEPAPQRGPPRRRRRRVRPHRGPGQRVRLAFKLFESEGVALVNLLRDGSGALDEMRERARDLGIVFDEPWCATPSGPAPSSTPSQVISANLTRAALEAAPVIADYRAGSLTSPARPASPGSACSMRPRKEPQDPSLRAGLASSTIAKLEGRIWELGDPDAWFYHLPRHGADQRAGAQARRAAPRSRSDPGPDCVPRRATGYRSANSNLQRPLPTTRPAGQGPGRAAAAPPAGA